MYKLKNLPQTPLADLEKARKIALDEGVKYVFIGNVPSTSAENTYCHNCGKILIKRRGYHIEYNKLKNGRCPNCGAKISGVWK